MLRRGATLGETLSGLPGVSSSYFGPNANRPTLRGLDGDRVRLLSNAGSTLDASGLSFDHALPVDPFVIDRVDVLRGAAALAYGSNVVGGVINSLDNRIPRQPIDGLGGRVELRGNTGGAERAGAAVLEGGAEVAPGSSWAWHADLAVRRADDLRVPRFRPVRDGVAEATTDRIANTASDTKSAALGAAWHGEAGYVGFSADRYRNTYGVAVDPGTRIQMQRDDAGLAGEWRRPADGLRSVRAQWNHTQYQHQEVEASGNVGTTFRNRGNTGRLELAHDAVAGWLGQVGVQFEDSHFEALGDEAFVPSTHTRQQALYLVEERPLDVTVGALGQGGTLSAALRLERVDVASAGDASGSVTSRFGTAQDRRVPLWSGALGADWRLDGPWSLQATLSHSERAPTYAELYANGLHLATGTYERGDAALPKERADSVDIGLRWASARSQMRWGAWASRYRDYLALSATGESVSVTDAASGSVSQIPIYAYRSVPADLMGLEWTGQHRWALASGQWTTDAKLDAVRGRDRASGEALPRLAPLRARIGATWAQARWTWRAELDLAARQNRVPTDDVPTPGFVMLNLAATWQLDDRGTLAFAKLANASDALGYNAASVRTVRELAPLPGRSLTLGLQSRF